MSIHGTLKTMAVSDLLQFLAAGRKTGTLKFARGGIVKRIFMQEILSGSSKLALGPEAGQGLILILKGRNYLWQVQHLERLQHRPSRT